MTIMEILPNTIAALASLIASVLLIKLALAMKGGSLSSVMNYTVIGIILAVCLHAFFELAAQTGLVNEAIVFPVMGTLLTVGSLSFIVAGYKGLRVFKEK